MFDSCLDCNTTALVILSRLKIYSRDHIEDIRSSMQSGVCFGPRPYVRACDALTQVIASFVASTGRRVLVHECFDPARQDTLVWSESEPVSVETLSESHVRVALPT